MLKWCKYRFSEGLRGAASEHISIWFAVARFRWIVRGLNYCGREGFVGVKSGVFSRL